jgi:hypothetical protein
LPGAALLQAPLAPGGLPLVLSALAGMWLGLLVS